MRWFYCKIPRGYIKILRSKTSIFSCWKKFASKLSIHFFFKHLKIRSPIDYLGEKKGKKQKKILFFLLIWNKNANTEWLLNIRIKQFQLIQPFCRTSAWCIKSRPDISWNNVILGYFGFNTTKIIILIRNNTSWFSYFCS